jgi:hypothetical protein
MRSTLTLIIMACQLAACATGLPNHLQPGARVDDVLRQLGPSNAEHRLPDGGRKLEFASGPFGKTTYMVRFDAQGRMLAWENVLDEAHFNQISAGMTQQQLLQALGRPSKVWAVRYHAQTVWSYRFEGRSCELFHVGITPQGVVEDTSYGPDPLCERDVFPGGMGPR